MKNICLRLANRLSDGSGAQVQRHLETIALAHYLNTSVSDGVISDFDSNPGDGIRSYEEKKLHVEQINSMIIPRILDCHKIHKVLESRLINYLMLNHLQICRRSLKVVDRSLALGNLHIALNVHNTATIVRRNPFLLEKLKIELTKRSQLKQKRKSIKIVAHIHGAKKLSKQMESRFIEIGWFVSIIGEISKLLESLEISYKVEVHTDIPRQPNRVWKDELGLSAPTKRIWHEEGILSKNGEMKLAFLDLEKLLKSLKKIEIVRDIPPIEVLHAFQNADILITNKSSLSFVGAFLNDKGIIVCTNSWLPRLNSWHLLKENPTEMEIQKFKDSLKNSILNNV